MAASLVLTMVLKSKKFGQMLDFIILEGFSNLNDAVILNKRSKLSLGLRN